MRRRVVPVLALLMSFGLAGCAGDEPSPEEEFQEAVVQGQAANVPTWQIGDYWTYEASAGGNPVGVSSFVVTGEAGGDYVVETDDQGVAYFDALFDISFMGTVRKSDLAGSQGTDRVEMFDWPLEAHKEWQTVWDGETVNMYADPMGPNQFHVMGHRASDEKMAVEYHYNAEKRWFEYIVFYDVDNGTEGFRLDLQESGTGFQGTIFRYAFGAVLAYHAAHDEPLPPSEVEIDAQWNELSITMYGTCAGAAAGVLAVGLNSDEYAASHPGPMLPILNEPEYGGMAMCHEDEGFDDTFVVENNGGAWTYGLVAGAPESVAGLIIEQRAVEALAFPFA